MQQVLVDEDNMVLRFDPDEEVISSFLEFVGESGVDAALVSGIGSAKEVELWYYDAPKKEYQKKVFGEPLEVVGISGNVGLFDGAPATHLHGLFSRSDYSVVGGHIHRLVVNMTVEIMLDTVGGELKREFDEETGLNLLTS